ncbi:MAG TPA: hypothetical protein VEN47_14735, partial [Myxococcota bacterium]|nr:hypothetical protein [Myxococcota bacterium]
MRRALARLVLALGALARAAAAGEPDIAVHVRLDRDSVYLHEQLLLSVEIVHPADARASWEAPPFDGFWAERLGTRALPDEPSGLHRTEFRRALFPTRAGEIEIAPSKLEVSGEAGTTRDVPVPGATVRVRPLPAGVPADALVGHVEVQVSTVEERVRRGKALSLAIELIGAANVWDAPAPDLEALLGPDVEVFAEPARVSIAESAGRALARRSFRYAIVPSRTGLVRLAPLSVPWFDPATGKVESAHSDALAFDVFEGPSKEESRARPGREPRPAENPAPSWPLWLGGALVLAAAAGGLAGLRRSALARLVAPGQAAASAALDAARAARGTPEFAALLARAVRAGVQARHRFDTQS